MILAGHAPSQSEREMHKRRATVWASVLCDELMEVK